MNGVIDKYYMMSCNTNEIHYVIYVRNKKVINHPENNYFKIIRYSFKIPIFRYYSIFKNLNKKHLNIIRYAGADFSLLFLLPMKREIFWELHTNYVIELTSQRFIGYFIKLFEFSIGKFILKSAKGIITTSNSIFQVNKDYYKYKCNYHLLLNSFIPSNPIISNIRNKKIINENYILIMASSFKFWHDLQSLIEIVVDLGLKLVIVGNTKLKRTDVNIIYYGYVTDPNELNNLISNSMFCIDSIGFDKLNLKETSSLKLFKYLEHGGRVVIFKNLPFKDSFLVPNFIIQLNCLDDLTSFVDDLKPLTLVEQTELKTHLKTNYSLDRLLSSETKFLLNENNR
tara:strand:- start:123 stop:1145 length:1023 start_codon:yes stop_codon:yes gene_type:complete